MFNAWPMTDRFAAFRQEMDRLFDEANGAMGISWPGARGVFPALNIWDAGDAVGVEAELPGVVRKDLEILVTGNELTIKGKRGEHDREKAAVVRNERGVGTFSRTVTLPFEVDADKIGASLRHGVLTLTLPKAEAARPRQITVKEQS